MCYAEEHPVLWEFNIPTCTVNIVEVLYVKTLFSSFLKKYQVTLTPDFKQLTLSSELKPENNKKLITPKTTFLKAFSEV